MVNSTSSLPATKYRWHKHIEDCTPSGAIGRFLLAILLGPLGILFLIYGSFALFAGPTLLPSLPLGLVLIAGGVVASTIAVLMFWVIYLSVIGNVESAKTYSEADATPVSEADRDDSIAVVKQQYAAGNISEAEFERRVENLLYTDAELGLQSGTMSHKGDRDTIRETD